jgi:pimeloyl-ACP methyl ester carboxylesterase
VDDPQPTPAGRKPWWRRWLRRSGIAVAALVLLATAGSLIFNAVTAGRARIPGGTSYVQAGDVRTRYLEWGTGGSPIVLVHGFAESADTWSRLGPYLARTGHRVYALDLTGAGYSERRGPYDAGHLARQLLAFDQAVHAVRPVLVGHSSGAAVAARATLDAPGQVGGLVFLDGDALSTGAGARSPVRQLLMDPYRTTLLRLAVRQDWLIRSIYSRQCGPACPPLDAAGLRTWTRPFQVAGAESGVWAMLDAGVVGLTAHELAGLKTLPLPKRVVFGARDPVFDAAAPAETAVRIGAPAPVLIPGARHLTMISNPAEVAAAIGLTRP